MTTHEGSDHRALDAVETLLRHVGEDPERDGLRETPRRVARAMREMTSGYRDDPAAILAVCFDETSDEMIIVRDIPLWSLCEHHLLPFHGHVVVGYVPDQRVVGLSKIARLVHCFGRRLQVQERLTDQIARAMMDHLRPRGVGVVVRATHLCMAARGVRSSVEMVTSSLHGAMREAAVRAEFLALAR